MQHVHSPTRAQWLISLIHAHTGLKALYLLATTLPPGLASLLQGALPLEGGVPPGRH